MKRLDEIEQRAAKATAAHGAFLDHVAASSTTYTQGWRDICVAFKMVNSDVPALVRALRKALEGLEDLASEACGSRYGPGCDAACKGVANRTIDAALAELGASAEEDRAGKLGAGADREGE